jgi:NAD(P)H-hydrate epimerase
MTRLTRSQVREIDRRSIEEFHIPGVVLMENAARAVADAAHNMLLHAKHRAILILCGGGNNGGDGLAAARHLHNAGFDIHIALTADPARYQKEALINWQITQAMHLPTTVADPKLIDDTEAALIIDAIFGTGLTSAPRPPFDQFVAAIERSGVPVLAVDIPSGLDCDTGQPLGPCVQATTTVTFVAEKAGFAVPEAQLYLGQVEVAEIGCPREIIDS